MQMRSVLACVGVTGLTLTAAIGAGLAGPAASTSSPGAQEGYGTIKGRLVWGGSSIPQREPIDTSKNNDHKACSKRQLFDPELIVDADTKGVSNGFAYLPTPKGKNTDLEKKLVAEHPKVKVDQIDCEFVPISTAVFKDQEVEFASSDPVGHNVHYIGFANNANFALGPNKSAEKKLVPDKRAINLVCDIHPWMKGNLMVFNHPFYAVTAKDGSFEIPGVPAGEQNLIVWQRLGGYVTEGGSKGIPVTVKAGAVTDVGEIKLDPGKVEKAKK
jgi:plastocyanin